MKKGNFKLSWVRVGKSGRSTKRVKTKMGQVRMGKDEERLEVSTGKKLNWIRLRLSHMQVNSHYFILGQGATL